MVRPGGSLNECQGADVKSEYLNNMKPNINSKTPTIEFLYFSGCPNSEPTLHNLKSALTEMSIQVEPFQIDVDPAVFDRPFRGSPSIVVNGIDLYTMTHPDAFEFACRTFEIDSEKTGILPTGFIRDRLRKVLSTETDDSPE